MSKKKAPASDTKKKAAAWKTESFDGALLFLLFHKRRKNFNPNDFSASEIQQHPLFEFDKYSPANFKRNCQTVANKVLKFEEKKTGVSNELKQYIQEVLEKRKDLFEGVEEEDDFDEDYKPGAEEDEDLPDVPEEDEASLSDGLRDLRFQNNKLPEQPPIEKANILPTARRSQSEKSAIKKMANNMNDDPFNYLVVYPDGRILGVTRLESGWDGSIYLAEDCKRVMKKTRIPSACFKSQTILQKHGLDRNNIHIVTLKAAMKKKRDDLEAKAKAAGTDWKHHDIVLWELPFEVVPVLQDISGDDDNQVIIEADESGVEWAYMLMKGVHVKEVEKQAPRIVRNRNRSRATIRRIFYTSSSSSSSSSSSRSYGCRRCV